MLRIGLMIDSLTIDAWIYQLIDDIRKSGFADVVFIIENTPELPKPKRSFWALTKARWKSTVWERYAAWDRTTNILENDAEEQKDLTSLLDGITRIQIEPIRKRWTDRFREEDEQLIRDAQLDVIIRFGFRIIRGPILNTARCGVWSYHHDDNLEYRGGPHSFWEIYEKKAVSGSILQILTDALDGGRVIYRSQSSTHMYSQAKNRNPILWKTAEFVMRRLRDLDARGMDFIESLPTYKENIPYTRGIYRKPDTPQMLYFLSGQFYRRIQAKLRSKLRGNRVKWFFALRVRSEARFDSTSGYKVIAPPADRCYADPFLIEYNRSVYLFFENYIFEKKRAHISCIEVRPDGAVTEPVDVLSPPYHLSYPFVFESNGDMYMIPESIANRSVELYKASEFPHKWVFVATLLEDILAADATIHFHNEKFWMFTSISNGLYSNSDELSIFYADSLLGPWTPHPMNPLVSDVRRARPAGRLFYEDGKLIRPSQDCSQCYGYALNFSEVTILTEKEYEEKFIANVLPDWTKGNLGTHHYTRAGKFEVIDGKFLGRL